MADIINWFDITLTDYYSPSPYLIEQSSTYNASSYQAWKVMDKNVNTSWLSKTDKNEWLLFDFGKEVYFNIISIQGISSYITSAYVISANPKDIKILVSNDKVNWTKVYEERDLKWTSQEIKTFKFNNRSNYRYLKLHIDVNNGAPYMGISELKIGIESKSNTLLKSNNKIYSHKTLFNNPSVIPSMTSNTAPSPLVASASSIYSTNYHPYLAFNKGSTVSWFTKSGEKTGWIQIDFGEEFWIDGVEIIGINTITDAMQPRSYRFLSSVDGQKFLPVGEVFDRPFKQMESRYMKLTPSKARYMRFEIIASEGHTYTGIHYLEYKSVMKKIIELPIVSEKNFINYGEQPLTELGEYIRAKSYVFQDGLPKENNKYIKQLNKKPLSINVN